MKLLPEKSRRGPLQQLSSQRPAIYGTMRKCQGKEDVTRDWVHTAPDVSMEGLPEVHPKPGETEGVQ
jgi:hypothetical protein